MPLNVRDSDLVWFINWALGRWLRVDVTSTIVRIRNVGTDARPELIEDTPVDSYNTITDFNFENAYAVKRVYTVTQTFYIDYVTFESTDILVQAQDPETSVTVIPPKDVNVSGPPLNANWARMRVVCPDPEAPWDVSRYFKSPPFTIE